MKKKRLKKWGRLSFKKHFWEVTLFILLRDWNPQSAPHVALLKPLVVCGWPPSVNNLCVPFHFGCQKKKHSGLDWAGSRSVIGRGLAYVTCFVWRRIVLHQAAVCLTIGPYSLYPHSYLTWHFVVFLCSLCSLCSRRPVCTHIRGELLHKSTGDTDITRCSCTDMTHNLLW